MVGFLFLLLGAERASAFEWQTSTPESQGLSRAKLLALKDDLVSRDTRAFLVIRRDRIVFEWYAPDHGRDRRHYTASMAKALVGGVSLAVALTDGLLDLDEPAANNVPAWRGDSVKSRITVRHLLTHVDGHRPRLIRCETAIAGR